MAAEPANVAEDALPSSPDAIEEAYDEVANAPATDSDAHGLLRDQSQLVREQIGELRRKRWRDFIITALGIILLGGVAAMIIKASASKAIVVEPFDAPPALAGRGLSAEVLASSVQDATSVIQAANTRAAVSRDIDNAWTDDIKVDVPSTGVSFGELDRLLRQWLGHETHIGGSLVINADASLTLTVRATGVPARSFTGNDADLSKLATQAAEYVYGRFEPVLFALYLRRSGRNEDVIKFCEETYARGPDAIRSDIAASWGAALVNLGRTAEAMNKYRLSVEIDPFNWSAQGNLIGTLYDTIGEEGSVRYSKTVKTLLAEAPEDRQPTADVNPFVNIQPLLQDWSAFITTEVKALAVTGGRGAYISSDSNMSIGEAEGHRHDWQAAQRYIAASPASGSRNVADALVRTYRLTEEGRSNEAVPLMRRAYATWQNDPDAKYTFPSAPCWLALSYGLTGRIGEAEQVMAQLGQWAECETFRGDIVDHAGNHALADRLYARAARLYPSLPMPFQHWGVALLHRGDLDGAQRRFERASANGPGWAEPLKGLGDISARRGDWKRAAELYDRAIALAPRWRDLRMSAGIARSRTAN